MNLLWVCHRHREGYDETDTSFHHKLPATTFIQAENHLELLADAHQVRLIGIHSFKSPSYLIKYVCLTTLV